MSWKRTFIWTCDICAKSVEKYNYGIPKGWLIIPAHLAKKTETMHACCSACYTPKLRLYIDDVRPMPVGFDLVARTYKEAIDLLIKGNIGHVSFDHDLGTTVHSGYDIAVFIEQMAYWGKFAVITWEVHSANPVGANRIKQAMEKANQYWEEIGNKSRPIVE